MGQKYGLHALYIRPLSRAAVSFPAGGTKSGWRAHQNLAGGGAKLFRRRNQTRFDS